ncbi:MAG: hypothetical protein ACRD5R_12770 [Candidatus Acidiferrales bacterium]
MALSVSGVSNAQNPVPVANNPSAPQPTTLPVNSAAPKDSVTISPQGQQAQTQAAQQAAQSQASAKAQNTGDSDHDGH